MGLLKTLFGKAPPREVHVLPANIKFAVTPGETVLESARKSGLNYPHDCTVGTCGSCRTKLLSGNVEAITPFGYTLSKDELDAGFILACQALPKTDLSVEVEIGGEEFAPIRQPARISETALLTHDIKRLTFEIDTPVNWKAGQYVNLYWDESGDHRSYSLAIAPSREGSKRLQTFVRHVPGGRFTDLLFSGDQLPENVEIDGPHGNFWLRSGTGPIICIAGGSGLAPILSLLSDAANQKVRRDCILLFGARGSRDLYGDEEIAAIRNAWTAGFDFWPILSEDSAPGLRAGMVTEHVPAALERLGPGTQAYLCGPPPMIDAGIHALHEAGIGLDDIYYDKFTDASTRA